MYQSSADQSLVAVRLLPSLASKQFIKITNDLCKHVNDFL